MGRMGFALLATLGLLVLVTQEACSESQNATQEVADQAGLEAAEHADAHPSHTWQVTGPETWGAVTNLTRLSRLRFSAQPDAAAIAKAAEDGVGLVINLRTSEEMAGLGFDEPATVEAAGMTYAHVPVRGAALDAETFARVEAIVAEQPDRQVWIHCASSNRVGAWLAWHMGHTHGLDTDAAVAIGRDAGMTSSGLEKQVRGLLAEPANQ